jgi:hypothetical protein
MSARQTRNQDLALVGSTATLTASPADANALADGEIRLFTADGVVIDNTNDVLGMDFRIAVGGANGKASFVSELINGTKLTTTQALNVNAPVAEVLENQFIGYNGTSGSIDAIDNNLYMVQVYIEDYLTSSHDGRYIKHFQYKSDSSATQAEIAIGLAGSAINNFNREAKNASGDPMMIFKALCNDALAAAFDFDETVSVTKGSKVIVNADATPTYNTGTAIAVGDFIRIGAAAASAVALDSDVYEVVAVSGADITLDRPVQVATGDRVTGSSYTQVITAAAGAAANWGINASGTTKDHVTGKEFYNVIRFNLNAKDFGNTTTPAKTAAVKGEGDARAVIDHEWFAAGNRGEYFRMGEPAIHTFVSKADKVTPLTYNITRITYADAHLVGFQDNVSPKSITLYTPTTGAEYMNDNNDGAWVMLQTISGLSGLDIS